MLNKIMLIGHVGKPAEVRSLDSGTAVGKFNIATSESFMKDEEWETITEWHEIVVWRKLAEKAKDLKKGALVYIEGKKVTRKWTDQDGATRYRTEVVASYWRVLNGKKENGYFPSEEPESFKSDNKLEAKKEEVFEVVHADGTKEELAF